MRIKYGDILQKEHNKICFTTNGFVTLRGTAVCGRGIALTISTSYDNVKVMLGKLITANGNIVQHVSDDLIAYPVKAISADYTTKDKIVKSARHIYKEGDTIPGYHLMASPYIIKRSAQELVKMADAEGLQDVALVRPGCGAGGLIWKDVYPIISELLDDRFTIYTHPVKTKTVFISGSRSIKKLNTEITDLLLDIMLKDLHVIVGDCYGVDTLVQEFFRDKNYPLVKVYHIKKPRTHNGYDTVFVEGDKFPDKDVRMVADAHYGLVIWDGKSKGSKANVALLKKQNKYVKTITLKKN